MQIDTKAIGPMLLGGDEWSKESLLQVATFPQDLLDKGHYCKLQLAAFEQLAQDDIANRSLMLKYNPIKQLAIYACAYGNDSRIVFDADFVEVLGQTVWQIKPERLFKLKPQYFLTAFEAISFMQESLKAMAIRNAYVAEVFTEAHGGRLRRVFGTSYSISDDCDMVTYCRWEIYKHFVCDTLPTFVALLPDAYEVRGCQLCNREIAPMLIANSLQELKAKIDRLLA